MLLSSRHGSKSLLNSVKLDSKLQHTLGCTRTFEDPRNVVSSYMPGPSTLRRNSSSVSSPHPKHPPKKASDETSPDAFKHAKKLIATILDSNTQTRKTNVRKASKFENRKSITQKAAKVKFLPPHIQEAIRAKTNEDSFHAPARPLSAESPDVDPSYAELALSEKHNEEDDWSSRNLPPHLRATQSRSPLPYTHRVEGLIQPSDENPLQDLETPFQRPEIARLAHGLDRALFNPGVSWFQDPRTSIFNFPENIVNIPKVEDFAFDRVTGFITSSRDTDLSDLAKREQCSYTGSTSSLTKLLAQIYFLISNDKAVDVSTLSSSFQRESVTFTPGQRMPVSVILEYNDGVYSTDSATTFDEGETQVLAFMGTLLEKYLTQSPEQFAELLKATPAAEPEGNPEREAYRYAKYGKIVMRSQLDCVDERLPGTGVFDLKTRAALPIRKDVWNYKEHQDYEINHLHGPEHSFEKEYYDLIRSAFLKYSFQVRIGNMDGVFVAYHNTARLFGFQYIPLVEMEERLYSDSRAGDRVFDKCIRLLEVLYDEITSLFPKQSVRCTWDAKPFGREMLIWVEPKEWGIYGEPPVVQLEINTQSYINGREVPGSEAVSAVDRPWTLHWSVARSSLSMEEIRRNRQFAHDKQAAICKAPMQTPSNQEGSPEVALKELLPSSDHLSLDHDAHSAES